MRRVLWLFAHQDDEVAAAARILAQRRNGDEVWCAYLTNGAKHVAAQIRNRESTEALATIGVTDVVFFDHRDGALHQHIEAALADVERRFAGIAFDEVGCLAWEGGHHDHDASHLVAIAFARRRNLAAFEVPLYNGLGTIGPLFRVLRPIGGGWTRERIALGDALRIIRMIGFYRSQRRTWLGLLPETFVRVVLLRASYVRRASDTRVQAAPHDGRLFYERRFGCSRESFVAATRDFVARHLR